MKPDMQTEQNSQLYAQYFHPVHLVHGGRVQKP